MNLKSYQKLGVDEETGEEIAVSKYLYIKGHPREYRFNAQNGQFSLYGQKILLDKQGKPLQSFTIQPISFCVYEDKLFGRAEAEKFAEIYFVDAEDCVSCLMINNTSVNELMRLVEPLVYDRLMLTDIELTFRPEKVTSKADPTKSWYIAKPSYEMADEAKKAEYEELVKDTPIFKVETITPARKYILFMRGFQRTLETHAHAELYGIQAPNEI